MKYAIVRNYKTVEQVRDYLPANYKVVHVDENGAGVLIAGEDDHGWTMEDYVIPRLASGLMPTQEVYPMFTQANDLPSEYEMDVPSKWLRSGLILSGVI